MAKPTPPWPNVVGPSPEVPNAERGGFEIDAADARVTLTRLTRIAERKPKAERFLSRAFTAERLVQLAHIAFDVTVETGDPIGRVLSLRVPDMNCELAAALMERCNEDTFTRSVSLRELALAVTQKSMDCKGDTLEEQRPGHARLFHNLGIRLFNVGNVAAAEEATREAVRRYRRLTRERAVFRDPLAGCLQTLAHRQRAQGQVAIAQRTLEEAVALARELAADFPDQFSRLLSDALNDLALILWETGQPEAALPQAEEAVRIRRQIFAEDASHRADLAFSLVNLSLIQSDIHRREAAQIGIEEAERHLRQLSDSQPLIHRSSFATLLSDFAALAHELGRLKQAREAAVEAVAIHRDLAARRPEAFEPDLASSLHNLAVIERTSGEFEESIANLRRAVALYRRCHARNPEFQALGLARTLDDLGTGLGDLDAWDQALHHTTEAVEIYRSSGGPEHSTAPNLAKALNNLGAILSVTGDNSAALQATQEASELYQQLPSRFAADRGRCLSNLSNRLHALHHHQQALDAAENSVSIFRGLVRKYPPFYIPDLAVGLVNLGSVLVALQRYTEAHVCNRKAVTWYRRLARQRYDVTPDLATAISNFAYTHQALGHLQPAIQAHAEACELRRHLVGKKPGVSLAALALSLHNYGTLLAQVEHYDTAEKVLLEAARYWRRLAETPAGAHIQDLAETLRNLGGVLHLQERFSDSQVIAEEAVSILASAYQVEPEPYAPALSIALENYYLACHMTGLEPVQPSLTRASDQPEVGSDPRSPAESQA